jgi:hypothetical protein
MKRIGLAVATAISFVLCVAAPAFAGSELPSGPDVEGTGGSAGGTAFTGANVSRSLLLLAVLIAIGTLALYVGRRRSHVAS